MDSLSTPQKSQDGNILKFSFCPPSSSIKSNTSKSERRINNEEKAFKNNIEENIYQKVRNFEKADINSNKYYNTSPQLKNIEGDVPVSLKSSIVSVSENEEPNNIQNQRRMWNMIQPNNVKNNTEFKKFLLLQ